MYLNHAVQLRVVVVVRLAWDGLHDSDMGFDRMCMHMVCTVCLSMARMPKQCTMLSWAAVHALVAPSGSNPDRVTCVNPEAAVLCT